jgi:uncharacterized protein YndB with AHSA1/START domain
MLKRLGIGCLVIVVLLVAGVWFSYRRMVAGGDTTSVTIAASPARVFASLANHDSLSTWLPRRRGPSGRHGAFAEGDTARIDSSSFAGRQSRSLWIVTALVPDRVLELQLRSDSRGRGMSVATRRDSLFAVGDSTTVITRVTSGIADGVRVYADGQAEQAVLDGSSKMAAGGLRMAAEAELKLLKSHIEGRPRP